MDPVVRRVPAGGSISIRSSGTAFPLATRAWITDPAPMPSPAVAVSSVARSLPLLAAVLGACVGDTPVTNVQPDASTPDTSTNDTGAPDTGAPDSATFSPSSLTGLVLWLDASKGVTSDGSNKVTAWSDQSGKGNHAAYVASDASVAGPPLLIANGVNGHPAIQFGNPGGTPSTTRLQIADSASLRLGTGDFYITAVAMWTNGDPGTPNSNVWGLFYHKADHPTYSGGLHFFGSFPDPIPDGTLGGGVSAGVSAATATKKLNNGTWRQIAFVRSGGTLTVRVNGTPDGTPTASATANCDATNLPAYIGALYNDFHVLQGKIAEMILVSGPLPANDVTKVESYLKAKYAL